MRVGILGGTFDPIHQGHLLSAERAREGAELDEVWFIPTNIPPHKEQGSEASAEHRLAMIRLAIENNPAFQVVDDEVTRGGISYSIDTVLRLQERHPHTQLHYIVGADMVMYLPKWHRIEKIIQCTSFIGLQRPGFTLLLDELPIFLQQKVKLVSMPQVDISSTAIRETCKRRESIRYLVDDKVRKYIEVNQLYEPCSHDGISPRADAG